MLDPKTASRTGIVGGLEATSIGLRVTLVRLLDLDRNLSPSTKEDCEEAEEVR